MTDDIRVLVIDDDFRVAGLHRDAVASVPGFIPLEAVHTLDAARQALRAHQPDLLLVDAYLPDGDGIRFVADTERDAFVLSAATDAVTVRRAINAGALAYLAKPFDATALTQERIDRAMSIMAGGAEPATVSRSATEQLILDGLGDDDEASAAEVAERVGISRATAQRHLAALATRGQVEVRLRYGTTGRPEHRYVRVGKR